MVWLNAGSGYRGDGSRVLWRIFHHKESFVLAGVSFLWHHWHPLITPWPPHAASDRRQHPTYPRNPGDSRWEPPPPPSLLLAEREPTHNALACSSMQVGDAQLIAQTGIALDGTLPQKDVKTCQSFFSHLFFFFRKKPNDLECTGPLEECVFGSVDLTEGGSINLWIVKGPQPIAGSR